ncbi:MAG: glycosyltransferase family 9 protein, partial [Chloroflexota bacterium]
LSDHGLNRDLPWLTIHPGASASSRRYPWQHYAKVARRLVEEDGFQVLFTGTADETELVENIREEMRAPSFCLSMDLRVDDFAALLALTPLLVTNNSGPVHLAAAVGTPVVVLYALTNPQHQPWLVPARVLSHEVPCKYCYKSICPEGHQHCLSLIEPDRVVSTIRELWKERAATQFGSRTLA